MKRRPVHVAELVARLVEGQTSEPRRAPGRRTLEVFRAFERIGPPVTHHAEPTSFRRGRLTLRVRSSAWLTELAMMQAHIVARLNERLPKPWIEELRLVLGSPLARREPPSSPPPRLSPRQREQVEGWARGLRHDGVRQAFARAAARSLSRGPVGPPPPPGPPGPRVMPVPAWIDPSELDEEPVLTYGYGDREVDRWKLRRARRDDDDDDA